MDVSSKSSSFLLKETFLPNHQTIDDIDKDQMEIKIRRRQRYMTKTYQYEKRYTLEGERIQELRIISARDYIEMNRARDPAKAELHKVRTRFVYDT